MQFEWDEAKHQANIQKHGIAFDMAAKMFDGFVLSQYLDAAKYGEPRMMSIGRCDGAYVAIITVVHTSRLGKTRLISARPASRTERIIYDEALQQALNG